MSSSTAAALGPYLPRIAIEWAGSDPSSTFRVLDGSLVFADISGFTALSERLARKGRVGAEELTATLNDCFAQLLAVAYDAGGSLLKFGGDALLLLFDGPLNPQRACASALRMRETMRHVGRVPTSVGSVRLRMSVGVHSGALHLFRVGSSHRELLVTGPGASTTVEMESAASAGEIVISRATSLRLGPGFAGAPRGAGFLLRDGVLDVPTGLATTPVEHSDGSEFAVPVALRAHLLEGEVEPEHRHASVAFVHFDDVDRLLGQDGRAIVAEALDELICDIQAAADEHGVTFLASDVDRDGGKVILVAGAPRALGNDGGRMLGCLRQIADKPREIPVRIGVNHGHVFVGEVGPPYRRTYTVMGDAVNLAARLMAKASPGEILSTAAVFDHASTEFDAVPVAPFTVKGKSQPVEAFAVGAPGARRVTRLAELPPFVGRDEEMATLLRAFTDARLGRGALIDVTGQAAIGKSRLVEEALADAGDLSVLRAYCEPHEVETPYFAFRFLLRALGGDDLHATVDRIAPELLPWLPLLGVVAAVSVPSTAESEALDPQFRRERTRDAVAQLFRALVHEPTALVVEDAQWLDELSTELLQSLSEAARDRPLVVCVVRRDEDSASPFRDGDATVLDLGPLDDDSVRALISGATGGAQLLPHERDELVARAGGNPLFAAELLRARALSSDEVLPETLEAVVATQIDRLPTNERRLLRYAAVLGTTFDVSLLSAVAAGEVRTARAAERRFPTFLEKIGPGLVRFRNECYRRVAYDALPFSRRRELHAGAGAALECLAEGREHERGGPLSFHFLQAQSYEKCWRYARLAADHARATYANAEAARLYERALLVRRHLSGVDDAEVALTWEALGDVSLYAGTFDRAKRAYERARRLRREPADVANLCAKEYSVAMHRGSNAAAVRWLRRGLRLLEGHDSEDEVARRADLRYAYAHNRLQCGRPREALEWSLLAADDARRSANRAALASAYLLHDWALMSLGQLDEPTRAREALVIREELGSPSRVAEVLLYLGNFAYMQGRWDEALGLWTRASDAYLRAGNVVDAAFGTGNSAEILVHQGRYEEAEPRLRHALEVWQSMGYSGGVADVLSTLGRLTLNRGDIDEATRLFDEVRRRFAAAGDAREAGACGALAECLLRQGSVQEALDLVEATLRRTRLSGDLQFTAMLHRLRGYASAGLGQLTDAWADFDESLAVARSLGAVFDVALTLEAISVVAELGGLPADESADGERNALLEQLGVLITPPPPLRLAA